MKLLSLLGVAGFVGSCWMVGCGSDDSPPGVTTGPGVGADAAPPKCEQTPAPQKPTASCEVTVESPPLVPVDKHVQEGIAISYCSNPPSSGPHYPIWAAFQEYTSPIDSTALAPYLVHSLEHGAVALLYKCDPPGCPDVVEQLKKVRDALTADPKCSATTRVRVIISPSTTIKTRVAATAWGSVYQAACVDAPSLDAWIRDHYAKGPEDLCNDGKPF